MRVLFGLVFQIMGIYLIGNCVSLQMVLNSESLGIVFLSLGICSFVFGYFLLFDCSSQSIVRGKSHEK